MTSPSVTWTDKRNWPNALWAITNLSLLAFTVLCFQFATSGQEQRRVHQMANYIRDCRSVALYVRNLATDSIDRSDTKAVRNRIASIRAAEDEALIAGREPQVRCAASTTSNIAR